MSAPSMSPSPSKSSFTVVSELPTEGICEKRFRRQIVDVKLDVVDRSKHGYLHLVRWITSITLTGDCELRLRIVKLSSIFELIDQSLVILPSQITHRSSCQDADPDRVNEIRHFSQVESRQDNHIRRDCSTSSQGTEYNDYISVSAQITQTGTYEVIANSSEVGQKATERS